MKLYQLIYVSKCNVPISRHQLSEILNKSQKYNSKHQITGILVFDHGHFFQVLEGNYNQVESLFRKIQQDKRHCRVNRISSCYIQNRLFSDWKMGYSNLEGSADLDFFQLRRRMKSLHDMASVSDKRNLANLALKAFIDLNKSSAKPVETINSMI